VLVWSRLANPIIQGICQMDEKELETQLARTASKEEKVSLLDAQAEEFFQKGKFSEAAKYFARALRLSPQPNAQAYFAGQAGICHYNAKQDHKALNLLLKSASLFDPDQPEFMPDMYGFVYFHLGSLFEYQGRHAKSLEARRVCEQYIDSQEQDTRWMLYAGISRNYEALGKHDEAIKYTHKAIEVLSNNDPGLSYLYESMGNNYMGLKQYQEALKYYSKVLELDPDFERKDEIYLKVANCHLQLTNDRMALESYQKLYDLKQLTGKSADLLRLSAKMALCHFRLKEYEKSLLVTLETLRRYAKTRVEKAEIRSYLSDNYYELGRYKEAIQEGEKTLRLSKRFPNDQLLFFRMALSYFKVGDMKGFARYRTLCRRMFPNDSWNDYLSKLVASGSGPKARRSGRDDKHPGEPA
jgi:tetratricopeptide (TPR) repeat protein